MSREFQVPPRVCRSTSRRDPVLPPWASTWGGVHPEDRSRVCRDGEGCLVPGARQDGAVVDTETDVAPCKVTRVTHGRAEGAGPVGPGKDPDCVSVTSCV